MHAASRTHTPNPYIRSGRAGIPHSGFGRDTAALLEHSRVTVSSLEDRAHCQNQAL